MTDAEVMVIGAGIVGLASAVAVQRLMPGAQVVVVDKEPGPARHQTGRNSGVVHSGLYYTPGSNKARLVADGRERLEQYCRERELPLDRCGKVVVATNAAELAPLAALERRGALNGVPVERISNQRLHELEPHVAGLAALHVPSTGITDYGAISGGLADDVISAGGSVHYDTAVDSIRTRATDSSLLVGAGGSRFSTRWLINCAGLHSDRIARLANGGVAPSPPVTIVPFRGEYHELVPSARHLVRNLIYPVPDPRWPFLGVHMTRMIDGSIHVGPNAVLSFGREAYEGGVDRNDSAELARDPGLRKLAARYWKTGATELLRSRSSALLLRDVRQLLPETTAGDLQPSSAGIRAQALAADGTLLDDFAFADSPGCVHVLNAPSPAATASLAIGEVVARRLLDLTTQI